MDYKIDRFKLLDKPNQKFIFFLALYFLIWSFVPAFLNTSVALDVSEGINWGSEWQWGYYKHPPFSSWVLYSFYKIFGHVGPYLLSQLCVLLTLFLIYRLGTKLFYSTQAWLGTLLTLAVYYYSYPTLEFNHNIAQFPIWAGLSLLFYNGVTVNKYRDWVLLGMVGGVGMLTKYSVSFLLIPMAIYVLLPQQWRLLKQPKPWLSAAIMLVIFAPHLVWLIQHDWLPFTYANGRSSEVSQDASAIANHFNWINFTAAQLAAHLPLLVMLVLLRRNFEFKQLIKLPRKSQAQSLTAQSNITLLFYLWSTPLLFLIILSLVFGVGLRDLWGIPMWSLSGLIVASLIKLESLSILNVKIPKYVAIWLTLATLLTLTYLMFGHNLRGKPSRMDWPEQALSLQAQKTWHNISTCQWDSVSGDKWLTALIAMNAPSSPYDTTNTWPSQMINGSAAHSPWMTSARLLQHGTLVIKSGDNTTYLPLLDALPKESLLEYHGEWQFEWPELTTKDASAEPLVVSWQAYVPKHCAK